MTLACKRSEIHSYVTPEMQQSYVGEAATKLLVGAESLTATHLRCYHVAFRRSGAMRERSLQECKGDALKSGLMDAKSWYPDAACKCVSCDFRLYRSVVKGVSARGVREQPEISSSDLVP